MTKETSVFLKSCLLNSIHAPVGFVFTLTLATLASTPDSEFGKRRSVINKENEGPGSGGKYQSQTRSVVAVSSQTRCVVVVHIIVRQDL